MPEEKSFIWIPFYEEMAPKLNAYRENRSELVELVKGIREKYRSYLTNKLFSKINDIDPFTVMGLINRSGFQRRSEIASYFKDVLKMAADAPRNIQSDWLGIPVLDNTSSVYATKKSEIDLLWDLFVELQQSNYDDSKFEKALQINGVALAKLTMAFYWINPKHYCPMDNNTLELLNEKYSWQMNKEFPQSFQYKNLLDFLHQKIGAGEIESIPVLSYEAWKKSHQEGGIRFWSGGIKWGEDNKFEDFKQNEYWQIGWDKANESKGAKEAWKNIKKIKENDFLAFHSYGGTNDLIIWQISKVISVDKKRGIVNIEQVNKDGEALFHGKAPKMEKGNWFGTLFPVVGATAINEIFGEYLEKDPLDMENQLLTFCKELLQNKKNVILQGAPGTGKTYNTAALALSMIGKLPVRDADEDDKSFHKKVMDEYEKHLIKFDEEGNVAGEGQIGFVTFHQSMDYEDFVEGIKPKTNNGQVSYEIENGIFKTICKNASQIKSSKKSAKIDFSKTRIFKMSLGEKGKSDTEVFDYCRENNVIALGWGRDIDFSDCKNKEDIKAKDSTWGAFAIEVFKLWMRVGDIVLISDGNRAIKAIARIAGEYEFHVDKLETMKQYRNVEWLYVGDSIPISRLYDKNLSQQSIYAFGNRIDDNHVENGSIKEDVINDIITGDIEKETPKNYVLIIDEINRGNVSKIFGELISLLEADKRIGGDHPLTVTLPYSKESFSVPSNLYIIGTMNTTDRSVGSIDYAVRRRFAFVTLEANENKVPEGNARNLFNAVKNFLNKSKYDMDIEDLMVGHSYFMDANNLQMKWQYEILPLLMEYHKDGIISKSPLKDDSGNEIADVKKDYTKFVEAWQKKESDSPNP